MLAKARLVSLVGPGGVGKTRLALRAATDLRRGFADGVWWVDLAVIGDPALVPNAVVAALDLGDRAGTEPLQIVLTFLRDSELLLVLDNCEHVLAASAQLVTEVLRAAPNVLVVTTSREPLQVLGEHVAPVPPLDLPPVDVGEPLSRLRQNEAVLLFTERAAAAAGTFELTDANLSAVVHLCRRLDGLPLAIELAAVRTRVLTVEQILDRLTDRFALLTGGGRAAVPRQLTLRTTIDWSYSLLSAPEQQMLPRSAVFAGTFDLAAVERIAAPSERSTSTLDVFAGLVEKSMVMREVAAEPARFRLLESIREYGLELLRDSGDETACRTAHLAWCRSIADAAAADMFGPRQADRFDRLAREAASLGSAIMFSLVEPENQDDGLELVGALWQYLANRNLVDGRSWTDAVLERSGGSPGARARALLTGGVVAFYQADTAVARLRLAEADQLGRQAKDMVTVGLSLVYGAWCAAEAGDQAGAAAASESAVSLLTALHHPMGTAMAREALGFVRLQAGNQAEARRELEAAEALCRTHGDRWLLSYVLYSIGVADIRANEPSRALVRAEESLGLKREIDDRVGAHRVLELSAIALARDGQHARAASVLGFAIAHTRTLGTRVSGWTGAELAAAELDMTERLGSARFTAAYNAGARMSFDDAVRLVLNERAADRVDSRAAPAAGGLSRRELEVAGLVAEGLSNKQVATRLFISERTVTTHVTNILNKLGFDSRVQIASWVGTSGS
jgi:predicted ATPase/DNA-binding CsgD family transcriptional regulator